MTKIKVKVAIWEKWNVEHIKKHSVSAKEANVATTNIGYHKKGHSGRYIVIGRSGERILTIILKRLGRTTYYVVTARDSSKKERRELYEKEARQNSKI